MQRKQIKIIKSIVYKNIIKTIPTIFSTANKCLIPCWKLINAPIAIVLITVILGSYYLPKLITESQLSYQQQLKEREDRYKYSQSLLNLYLKRLYLAKNYYWNYKYEDDFLARKDKLWDEYQESVKEWNIQLVANIFAIEKYSGKETREYFENEVQNNLRLLHNELLHIRDNEDVDDEKIEEIILNVLDNRMYRIAYQLSGI